MPVPDMIGMVVHNMERALAFYRLLGLSIPAGAEAEDHVEIRSNGYRLAWDSREMVEKFMGKSEEPRGHRMGMAFLCDSPAQVDHTYALLVEAGNPTKTAPFDAFWGQRYAQVVDPDGNIVDLFCPLS